MSYRRVECVEVILKGTWQSCKETPNSLWWQMVGKPELVLKIHFCHKFMSHPSISVWKMTKEKTTRLFPLIQEPNNDYKNRINTQIVGITENRTGYWQRPEDCESSDLEKSLKLAKKRDFLCHILASKWKIDYQEIENYLVNIVLNINFLTSICYPD